MTTVGAHAAYVGTAPEPLRPLLEDVRATLSKALPDPEAVMMYGMPGFRIAGAMVAGYAAFSKQCGLYVDAGAIAEHAAEIVALGLKATKTGVTFSPARPLPDELVRKLALSSRRSLGV